MNSHWVTLGEVLHINPSKIALFEHVLYKRAVVQPYPRGIVLKTAKSGFDFPKKQQTVVKAGQFIVSKVRVHRKIWAIVPPELDGAVVNQSYLIFDLQSGLDPTYLAAYLSTPLFKQAALATCTINGRLSIHQFAKISIPLPSIEEQSRIAGLWNSATAVLEHTAEIFSSIVEIKFGVARELFRDGNSSWEQKALGECSEMGDSLYGSDVLSVRPLDEITLGTTLFHEGGIRIAPHKELDGPFLYYYLESQKQTLRSALSATKSGVEDALWTLPLPLPTLYEQRKIASIIQQHDEALLWLRAEQAALRHLTQGFMHNIFSGSLNLYEAIPLLQNLFVARPGLDQ